MSLTREGAASRDGVLNSIAGPGHNTEPDARTLLADRLEELLRNADRWVVERAVIESDEVAGRAGAALEQVRVLEADLDKARMAEKRPHLDANTAIDAWYSPLGRRANAAKLALQDLLAAFLRRKRDAERLEAERLRQQAERERREAEQARERALATGKVSDVVKAEEKAEKAESTAATATKVATAAEAPRVKGNLQSRATSLRTVRTGTIDDWPTCLDNYSGRREVRELVQRLVDADVRGGAAVIPGCTITTGEKAQ